MRPFYAQEYSLNTSLPEKNKFVTGCKRLRDWRRRPGAWRVVSLAYSFLLLLLTLYPFAFKANGSSEWFILSWGKSDELDFFNNCLLFMPLGFGLDRTLFPRRSGGLFRRVLSVLFVGLLLSYSIEVLQSFVSSRFSAFADVIANGVGTLLGLMLNEIIVGTTPISRLAAFEIVTVVLSTPLQLTASLSNWDSTYPLLVGNSRPGNQPWTGTVSFVDLRNRAMTRDEIRSFFGSSHFSTGGTVAHYDLTRNGDFRDINRCGPQLAWKGGSDGELTQDGARLGSSRWLESPEDTSCIVRRIVQSGQFTLMTRVTTGSLDQRGPARIVSSSPGPGNRNFSLAQDGSSLVFRLRTPLTGPNGTLIELVLPNTFSSSQARDIAVTYDGNHLFAYVNGTNKFAHLKISPGLALWSYFLRPTPEQAAFADLLYYIVIFVPLCFLLSATVPLKDLSSRVKPLINLFFWVLGQAILLESIAVLFSNKKFLIENVAFAVLVGGLTLSLMSVSRRWTYFHSMTSDERRTFETEKQGPDHSGF